MIMPAISSGPSSGDLKTSSCGSSRSNRTECAGCGTLIQDRYYLLAVDRQWHVQCLKCCQCKTTLDSELTCFSRDGQIYCKDDYYRIFAMKRCTRCGQGIYASELVMRVRDNIYHIQCFTCAWCNTTLSQGDYFGLKDRLVYCRTHYELLTSGGSNYQLTSENAVHPSTTDHHRLAEAVIPAYGTIYSPGSTPSAAAGNGVVAGVRKGRPRKRKGTDGSSIDTVPSGTVQRSAQSPTIGNITDASVSLNASSIDPGCLSDGQSSVSGSNMSLQSGHPAGQRTKRMRTSFKHHQLRTMKSYFSINQNPDAKDLKQLAQKTGLSKRVLQVWFQNARAKWRRNNLKLSGDGVAGDLSMGNGQTSLLAHPNPSSPSTGIASPNGSTRPFSSPSPSPLSVPSHDHQSGTSNIEYASHSHTNHNQDSIIPIPTFQELF